MKRDLFPLLCVVALGAVLALAAPGVAQERAEPFRLVGMSKTAEVVDDSDFPWSSTLRFTILGKGSIGDFEQIALVHFTWVGEGPPFFEGPGYYLVEESSEIYVLGDDGQPTRDVIYLEACGVQTHIGPGASGDFVITGGKGIYKRASGSGKMVHVYPGIYTGEIYR